MGYPPSVARSGLLRVIGALEQQRRKLEATRALLGVLAWMWGDRLVVGRLGNGTLMLGWPEMEMSGRSWGRKVLLVVATLGGYWAMWGKPSRCPRSLEGGGTLQMQIRIHSYLDFLDRYG